MADPKTKNATNGVVNGKPLSKPSKLLKAIHDLLHSADAVKTEFGGGLPDLEKLVESEKNLRQEVEDKNNEIDKIKKEKDEEVEKIREEKDKEIEQLKADLETERLARSIIVEDFEGRVKVHNQAEADSVVVSQKLAEAQQTIKTKETEIETAEQRAWEFLKSATRLEGEVKTLTTENERVVMGQAVLSTDLKAKEAQLAQTSANYQQLKHDVGENLLKDYTDSDFDHFHLALDAFAEQSRALVRDFFGITDKSLNVADLPQQLEYLKGVPLPKTGSSGPLRRVVAQAVIARFLRTHIFQPFFLPSEQHSAGHKIFEYLQEDAQRATVFRCQILAICERNNTGQAVAKDAVEEVYKILYSLVPAAMLGPLRDRLKALFSAALEMWDSLQRSRQLIFCEELDDEDEDDDESQRPRDWDEYGARQGKAGDDAKIVATLFPQVIVEEDDDIQVIYPGVGLWSDQDVVVMAKRATSPVNGRANGRVNGEGARPTGRCRSSSIASSVRA